VGSGRIRRAPATALAEQMQNEPPRIHPAKGQPVAATRIHASKPVRHPVRGIPFEGPRDPRKSTEIHGNSAAASFCLMGEVHRNPRKSTENKCNSEDLSRYLGCRVSSRSATKIHGLGLGFRVRVEGLGFVGLGFRVTDQVESHANPTETYINVYQTHAAERVQITMQNRLLQNAKNGRKLFTSGTAQCLR